MSKKEKIKIADEVAPNLVPMIDIMFLLLLFFMLSADMGQRELEEVHLPMAKKVKEDKKLDGEGESRLTVNVFHLPDVKCDAFQSKANPKPICREDSHWRTRIKGKDFSKAELLTAELKRQADPMRGRDPKNPDVSEKKVMIRVDELAPYGLAQKAMNACANAGIYKIEVGASIPMDQKKKH